MERQEATAGGKEEEQEAEATWAAAREAERVAEVERVVEVELVVRRGEGGKVLG